MILLFTIANVYISYIKIKATVEEAIANQSLEAAKSIAASMDMETYQNFLNEPTKNKYYWEICNYLNDAREKLGALYVYTIDIENPTVSNAMIVGFPKTEDVQKNFPIGELAAVPEQQVKTAYYEGVPFVTGEIEDPRYGTYLTVGVPIESRQGKVLGYLAIDISANTLNQIKQKVLKDNILLFIFNGVLILVVIVSFYLLQRWYQKEVTKEVGYTEDTYQSEITTLITSISSFRHDFTNHIQVLHGFLQLEETEFAKQYLLSLSKEVEAIKWVKLDIDHSGLSILLQTKKLAAQNHHIDINFTIARSSFDKIKTTDLIKILSNLIDNAIDAAIEFPDDKRKITISCQEEEAYYEFIVANTGPKILNTEQIFKQGYSTKEVIHGKLRGQGLFIVEEVVHKYNGVVSIESTDLETVAVVKIPIK